MAAQYACGRAKRQVWEALLPAAAEMKAWLDDWRTTAPEGIKRHDYRIMLGISKRRTSKDEPEAEGSASDSE